MTAAILVAEAAAQRIATLFILETPLGKGHRSPGMPQEVAVLGEVLFVNPGLLKLFFLTDSSSGRIDRVVRSWKRAWIWNR